VREPGDRAKIAVTSNEKDVDPVGACVGMKGSRVQAIIKELRGEKIDIIEWSDEPSVFAANALSPAKVSQVRITNINDRKMEVIVGEDQLSLAIGKRGQNVRLATRLVGWDIDIVSEEVLKKEIASQMNQMISSGAPVPITALEGVSAAQAEDLKAKGINDVDALAAASVDALVDILDISLDDAEKILSYAMQIVEARNAHTVETPEENNQTSEGAAQAENNENTENAVSESLETNQEETIRENADVEPQSDEGADTTNTDAVSNNTQENSTEKEQ
jgi:N utilization substance protein A